MIYPELPGGVIAIEEAVLERWRDEDLFRRTLERGGEPFVFYEGPPTANGRPGLHHIISRTIKDLVCRHRALSGRSVTRIAGWDTHGLPVEIEAEKKLGISGKPEIEAYGIADFNRVCRESVFTYKREWEELSERIGYWLEYWRPYVTFSPEYVESVWWILKRFADSGLLYPGHKSVPYCPRCGTALSSHEVAQGYRDVVDPSLTFGARVEDDEEARILLAWTTTPWTVPSNAALAVHPEIVYATVRRRGTRYVVAESRVEAVFGEDVEIVDRCPGRSLVGLRYRRPLDLVAASDSESGWRVYAADWTNADDGTGIVHIAPAFGADDHALGLEHGLPFLNPVDDTGRFRDDIPLVGGTFVKEADELIVNALRARRGLFSLEKVEHSYPHCWRCGSPLIYMARDSWFIATSRRKDDLLANNDSVAWHPPEIGANRFGDWLRGNMDWALSRDRYWGTPLPVWICDADADHVRWVGSLDELDELVGGLPDDFDPHRPFIDELVWPCEECDGAMRRSPSVIDVWFDSGAMPFAQWHYPFENAEEFEEHFPADFICEGLDQTRGWFYSLMAVSTLLDKGPPFRSVVVNDLVLDAQGRKMSKSKGNVVDPWDAISEHGSDPLRWYFVTASNPWNPMRYDSDAVNEASRRFFGTLLNTYQFFALYANVEDWTPPPGGTSADASEGERFGVPVEGELSVLDRWLLSRLAATAGIVDGELRGYRITGAYRALAEFVVDDLSNWYVRRGRPRYWRTREDGTDGGSSMSADARAAFSTMWIALRTVSRLLAPVAPMVSDWIHRAVTGESVHMSDFPTGGARDERLEEEMALARRITSLGRAAREEAGVRVRQPLRRIGAVLPGGGELSSEIIDVVRDELNVKGVEFLADVTGVVRLEARPSFRALGPRFGKTTKGAAQALRDLSQEELAAFRAGAGVRISLGDEEVEVLDEWLEVREVSAGNLVVKAEAGVTVAIDPEVDEELRSEGLARELVNRIQRLRRESDLEVTDRIRLRIAGDAQVEEVARSHEAFISGETLALELVVGTPGVDPPESRRRELAIDGLAVELALSRWSVAS